MSATNDVVMPNDLSDLCRVCLQLPQEEDCLDLTTIYDEDDHLTYGECFTICTQIDLGEGDNLPHNLCRSCGLELQMSYDFYKKVEDSKRTLEQYKQEIQQDCIKIENSSILVDDKELTSLTDVTTTLIESKQFDVQHDAKEEVIDSSQTDNVLINANASEEEFIVTSQNSEPSEIIDMVSEYGEATESVDNDDIDHADAEHSGLDQGGDDILVMEEHLDIHEFHNIETLEDEDIFYNPDIANEESLDNIQRQDETVSITLMLNPREKRTLPGNGPPFFCELCGHESTSKALLASHRHRKHRLKERTFSCTKCEKIFHSQQKLNNHLQRPFCDPYPIFKCEHCSKTISGHANYKIHLRFHQKIYPYVCHACGKGFMLAIHLKTHIQTKHENKRYVCEHPMCGKLFQSQNSLKAHTYVHLDSLPYRCEYCEKMFPNKGGLKYHIRKSHEINHTLDELDRMLVGKEIILKTKAKSVDLE